MDKKANDELTSAVLAGELTSAILAGAVIGGVVTIVIFFFTLWIFGVTGFEF